jgi:signal transduction histidine kinase
MTFFRANNASDISGTGLGLSVVKAAVELHDGTINVSSQVDHGTTFKISLPHIS